MLIFVRASICVTPNPSLGNTVPILSNKSYNLILNILVHITRVTVCDLIVSLSQRYEKVKQFKLNHTCMYTFRVISICIKT